jgi:hypothetical protein
MVFLFPLTVDIQINKYTYEQWRQMFDPEVEQLNREGPEQMQGQQ